MKKKIIFVVMIFMIIVNIASCNKDKNNNTIESTIETQSSSQIIQTEQPIKSSQTSQTTQSTQEPDTKTVYDVLNDLSKQNYGKIKLNIATFVGDIQLNAEYILTASNVSYSVEQLNLLPTDGNFDNLSPNYKRMLTGTAVVEEGKITKMDGDKVTLPEYDELNGSFDFKEVYFSNVKNDSGEFSADVILPSRFLGTDKNISGLKIEVKYNETALENITMVYKTANSTVTTVYEFEK